MKMSNIYRMIKKKGDTVKKTGTQITKMCRDNIHFYLDLDLIRNIKKQIETQIWVQTKQTKRDR